MRILLTSKSVIYLALISLLVGIAPSAYAVPPNQLLRNFTNQVFTGGCCNSWNEAVSVVEPKAVVPVVVTWSTDYQLKSLVFIAVGISLNGGPCLSFGPGHFEEPISFASEFDSRTFQFVIEPAQGLHTGNNTFALCGGGLTSPTDSITIGFNTLEVRLK